MDDLQLLYDETIIMPNIEPELKKLNDLILGYETIYNIRHSVEQYGVTPALEAMFGEALVSFNIRTNSQTVAVEGLTATLKQFLQSIINFCKRIGQWIADFCYTWINKNSRYYHRINRLNQHLQYELVKVDVEKFASTEITGKPYSLYKTHINAVTTLIQSLNNTSFNKLENINIKNTFGTPLEQCGWTFVNGEMHPPYYMEYRSAPARVLMWTPLKVWEFHSQLTEDLLKHNRPIEKLQSNFEATLAQLNSTCESALNNNNTVDPIVLAKQRAACNCLIAIVRFTHETMSGLAYQYIHMVNRFSFK